MQAMQVLVPFFKNIVLFLVFGILPIFLVSFVTFSVLKVSSKNAENEISKTNILETSQEPKNVVGLGQIATNTTVVALENYENVSNKKQEEKKIESNSKVLNIPLRFQKYNLNCEAASLQMALLHFNINKTQEELLDEIGYAKPFKKTYENGKLIWADPNIGFVGDEKGKPYNSTEGLVGGTGWGVNNGPVANAAKKFLPNSREVDNAKLQDIIDALNSDKPVIWWHVRDDARKERVQYFTPEGKELTLFQNHVAVIIGYSKDNAGNYRFIVNDPVFGKITLNQETFERWWKKFDNDITIVG